ncbi:glycosyltransferase 87 family protein [Thermocrispum municipale]|uniref:glycosyltransferase 87 family protein n=1 Tax=Thermocrispum municipale TaxID=37926 RepID=UPI000406F4EC|nr:glycosyltransferase 87 family protein [Thermocrispum municipale]
MQSGKATSERVTLVVSAVVAALSIAYFYAVNIPFAHIDLEVYRFAVWRWWEGGDIYGDLPPVNGGLVLPFIYPPFAAVTAIPFAVLPWTLSYTLLYVLGIACIVGTVYLVGRHLYPQASRRMTMAAAGASLVVLLCLEPLRETFAFGQINLLLMGLVAIDCLARRTRWPRGIGVGLAAAIKLTPAVFALYFLLRRDYRAFWVSAATGAAATALGFVVNPSGSVTYWFGGLAGAADVSGSTYRTNQTVQAVLARLGMDGAALTVVTVVVVLILLALVVVGVRTNTPETGLMLCAALSLLASPTSWSHHWVWIAPAVAVMAYGCLQAWRDAQPRRFVLLPATVFTVAMFILAPFHQLPGNDDWNNPPVDLEQLWTPMQHLIGDVYVILGIAWIVGVAVAGLLARRRERGSERAGKAPHAA